jgi:hypothetical protein
MFCLALFREMRRVIHRPRATGALETLSYSLGTLMLPGQVRAISPRYERHSLSRLRSPLTGTVGGHYAALFQAAIRSSEVDGRSSFRLLRTGARKSSY